MPVPSLLNIDPDKLFEQHSISEIEEIQKKIQNEMERKREDLRTMVGERYRDLIEAADTISQMKLLSEKVIHDVNKMKESVVLLQEQQVSGFKFEPQNSNQGKSSMWSSVASQIKILVDIPEHIWEAIDKSEFTQAALLFLLARYIKTSLEINPSFKMDKYFPVVLRQWSSIAHFKEIILRGAENSLKSQHLPQVTCSGLLSLSLLDNLTAGQLLERYLSLRSDSLRAVLSSHTVDSAAIKQKLCDSYALLIYSIVVVSQCFPEHVDGKEGLLWKELYNHVGPKSHPTLHLLKTEDDDVQTSALPTAIKDFRPMLDRPLEVVPDNQIHEAVSNWLVWVRQFVKDQGGHLFQKLSSLRNLQGLKDAPMVMCEEWPLVAQKLLRQPNLDLWNDLYRPLITVRAQQLVSVHWDAAFKALQQQIRSAYESAAVESKQTEVDLLSYMWKESPNDLNNLNNPKTTKGLWLKSKGITPRVAELCAALERRVCSLLGDLASLCPDQEVDPALLAISHTLKAHQQTVCSNLVQRLVQFVQELLKETTQEAGVMLMAKFLQSVPELCPSLTKCLASVDTKTVSWQESLSLIQTECVAVYNKWCSLASQRILKHTKEALGSAVPHLHSIPQWEEITIEEEGEAGQKLQSVLKVPCRASLNLQSALHQLASLIGHVAVPKQISEQLVDSVLISIVDLYNQNVDNNLTQTQYLQMLLDMKYLAQLFNVTINKDLKSKSQQVVLKLESKIDPFDLNVFTPYINYNVKTTVHRTQALLGVMGTAMGPAVTSSRTEEASVIALSSSTATWFPLLHITAPRVSHPPARSKNIKSPSSAQLANTSADIKPSSSSSFFGVMATDWFG